MSQKLRMQIAMTARDDLPRDVIVNTLHFEQTGAPFLLEGTTAHDLAHDAATLFANQGGLFAGMRDFTAKLYDIGASGNHPPLTVQTVSRDPSSVPNASTPREIALCLSYAAAGSGPRRRGRIYVGPWNAAGIQPSADQQNALVTLGHGIADLGGTDVKWSVYSPTDAVQKGTDASYYQVESVWVDNEWDTVRSRGRKPTSRISATFEG
jgi:hypothetical protein